MALIPTLMSPPPMWGAGSSFPATNHIAGSNSSATAERLGPPLRVKEVKEERRAVQFLSEKDI